MSLARIRRRPLPSSRRLRARGTMSLQDHTVHLCARRAGAGGKDRRPGLLPLCWAVPAATHGAEPPSLGESLACLGDGDALRPARPPPPRATQGGDAGSEGNLAALLSLTGSASSTPSCSRASDLEDTGPQAVGGPSYTHCLTCSNAQLGLRPPDSLPSI